nr:hypothetical protein [Pseudoalteromonas sp. OOF1S-7]
MIVILHCVIVCGLLLIFIGHSLLNALWFTALGPVGYALGAACIAIGLVCSLPTKIYLTILLMRREK